jgi:hypothetical protein
MNDYLQRNNAYLARQEIDKLLETISRDPSRLEQFGFKVYSQSDEDGIIEEIFKRLSIKRGTFCEIGVETGLECNTLYLLHKGWSGSWIDANSEYVDYIKDNCPFVGSSLKLCNAFLTRENINETLYQLQLTRETELDFMSIDVDGNDIHLFSEMEVRPKVLCIEYNAKWRPNISVSPVYDPNYCWQGNDYMGSSLKSLVDIAKFKSYELVGTTITGTNAFFVRKDLVKENFSLPIIENLYNPPRYWLIYDHYWFIGHGASYGKYIYS